VKKELAEIDIVDYIEADDDERAEIDDEFQPHCCELAAAMHVCGAEKAGVCLKNHQGD
jgi:hypothetical protein